MRVRVSKLDKSLVRVGGGWGVDDPCLHADSMMLEPICASVVCTEYFERGNIEASLLAELTKVHHCSYSTHPSSIYVPMSIVMELKLDKHSLLKNNSVEKLDGHRTKLPNHDVSFFY